MAMRLLVRYCTFERKPLWAWKQWIKLPLATNYWPNCRGWRQRWCYSTRTCSAPMPLPCWPSCACNARTCACTGSRRACQRVLRGAGLRFGSPRLPLQKRVATGVFAQPGHGGGWPAVCMFGLGPVLLNRRYLIRAVSKLVYTLERRIFASYRCLVRLLPICSMMRRKYASLYRTCTNIETQPLPCAAMMNSASSRKQPWPPAAWQ